MKTILLASVLVLTVAGARKDDPWAKMPVSVMVDDRRNEGKLAFSAKLFWDGVDSAGLLRRGVDSIVPVTWRPRDRS
jgi:hypothetical protein